MAKTHPEQEQPVVGPKKRARRKSTKENKTGYSTFKPTIQTRAWGDDLREGMSRAFGHEVKDDELLRRVFAVYEQQEHHAGQAQGSVIWQDGKPSLSLEQWYITTLSIQKLVGGRKDAINAYLDAHRDEVEEHHNKLDIKPSYNRKAEPITEMITIPEEATVFPWGTTGVEAGA